MAAATPRQAITVFPDARLHLAFSVLVSLFGMVNTLVLSALERTRELGMLRAVGMTRRQARQMIRHASGNPSKSRSSAPFPVGSAIRCGMASPRRSETPSSDSIRPGWSGSVPSSVAGGIALAVVAGVGSAASPWQRTPIGGSLPAWGVGVAVGVGSVLVVIGVLVAWVGTPGTLRGRRRRRTLPSAAEVASIVEGARAGVRVGAALLVLLGVVCLLAWPLLGTRQADVGGVSASRPAGAPASAPGDSGQGARSGLSTWFLLPGIAAFVVLAPAAFYLRRRRWRVRDAEAPASTEAVPRRRPTIDDALREADPRAAVVHAYAVFEATLAEIGLTRQRGETVADFLARLVRRLPRAAPSATSLTALFEEARYSDHQIAAGARDRAITALREIDSLVGASG